MAYRLIQFSILLLVFWRHIDAGAVLHCTVYPVVLQPIRNNSIGTIGILNSTGDLAYFTHVSFDKSQQFPLRFPVAIIGQEFPPGRYVTILEIYDTPRYEYDLPLWVAESVDLLNQSSEPYEIVLRAYNDNPFIAPCIFGVILNTYPSLPSLSNNQLHVKVDGMDAVTMDIHSFTDLFPILFLITRIPENKIKNSTSVVVLIDNPDNIIAYKAREQTQITSDSKCSLMLFHVTQEQWLNLTIILSAHVFTSVELRGLAVAIRIFTQDYLIFEQTYVIDVVEFPYTISSQKVPISQVKFYSIEATIVGPTAGYTIGVNVFQGAKTQKLIPGISNTVQIPMYYIGPEIGTTILGTIYQSMLNESTWPLKGSNLAIAINNPTTNVTQAIQFTIYDQTFPLEFVLLNLQTITANFQNLIITVTITFLDATVIWDTIFRYQGIRFQQLNRININVTKADGYQCKQLGGRFCNSQLQSVNRTCCSQYICVDRTCQQPSINGF